MTELTPEEFENSFLEPADNAAIEYYLSVTDEVLLQQATSLYSSPANQDLGKILKDAQELLLATTGRAPSARQEVLLSMNRNTLIELAGRILCPDALFTQVYISRAALSDIEPELDGPIKYPVYEMLLKRGIIPKNKDLILDEKMSEASAGIQIPCPEVPCELEVALRWAADAPDSPITTLKKAYVDWITTIAGNVDLNATEEQILESNREIQNSKADPTRVELLRNHIKALKANASLAKQVATYKASFKPGKLKPPKMLGDYVKRLMSSQLGPPPKLCNENDLLLFASGFRPFWKEHAQAYLKLAEKKSSTNRRSGRGGPTSRMGVVWKNRTTSFIEFAKGKIIPDVGSDEWSEFFEDFSLTLPVDPRTRKKIAGFMSTIFLHKSGPVTDKLIESLINLLEAEKVKAVDPMTIRSCLEHLRKHNGSPVDRDR